MCKGRRTVLEAGIGIYSEPVLLFHRSRGLVRGSSDYNGLLTVRERGRGAVSFHTPSLLTQSSHYG